MLLKILFPMQKNKSLYNLKSFNSNFYLYLTVICFISFACAQAWITRHRIPEWDEAVYIGIGKFLFSIGHAGLFESIRPVVLPIILGFFWKLRLSPFFCGVALEILISSILAILTCKLSSNLFKYKNDFVPSAILAASPLFIFYSTHIYTEIPSTLFAVLAFYAFINKSFKRAGAWAGLAALTRFPQCILLIIFTISLIYDGYLNKNIKIALKNLFKLLCMAFAVFTPTLIFNLAMHHEGAFNIYEAVVGPLVSAGRAMSWTLEHRTSFDNYIYYFLSAIANQWILAFSFFGLFSLINNKIVDRFSKNSFLFCVGIYLIYYSLIPHKEDRYFLVILPFIAILSSHGLETIFLYFKKSRLVKSHQVPVFSLVLMIIFMNAKVHFMKEKSYPELKIWLPTSTIVEDYFKYFKKYPAKGILLTSDPRVAVYTDLRYEPYYAFYAGEALSIYRELTKRHKVGGILFSPWAFECPDHNILCQNDKVKLIEEIMKNKILFQKKYYGFSWYILKPK